MTKHVKTRVTYPRETLRLYWEQIRKDKLLFYLMAICIPLSAVIFDTVIPYLLSRAVGTFVVRDTAQLQVFLWSAGIVAAVGLVINMIGYQSSARHESKVRNGLIETTLGKLLHREVDFFANQKVGALTSRLGDFVDSHIELQSLFFMKVIPFALNTILGIVLIALASPLVAVIALCLVMGVIIQVRFSKNYREAFRAERKALRGETYGLLADIIANNQTVKVFAKESQELASVRSLNQRFRRAYVKDFMILNIDGTARLLVMNAVQIAAIYIIAHMLLAGTIELGIAIFTLAYMQRFATHLFELGMILVGYDTVLMTAAPMTELMLQRAAVKDKRGASILNVTAGTIQFDEVRYAYSDAKSTAVIDSIDLTIAAGQRVGIVGPSGAGKTTLTKLLLRYSNPTSGALRIDGQDISTVTQQSLRDAIAYVPQEPLLFHRTLVENIAYAQPDASKEMARDAAARAHALEFIDRLPDGLDTVVGERGVKLSGGQRQRIAIARAILKDAPILVLDEATSALDSESEKLIQASLNELMKNRTSIVIAHRLSTIAKLDRIIVLENGTIVEDGTHAELLRHDGIYAKLWKHQSGGFIEE